MTGSARGRAAIALLFVVLVVGLLALWRQHRLAANEEGPAHAQRALRGARVPGIGYASATRDGDDSRGIGIASTASGAIASGDTPFEAASIGKTIVATCVMQLVEQGRLGLDVDVSAYLGFPVRHPHFDETITLRRLLTHRASLRDQTNELLARRDEATLAAFLERYVHDARPEAFLEAPPGTATRYSNVGVSLAALVVERATGDRFDRHVEQRVFVPLRMSHSSYGDLAGAAAPHVLRNGVFIALPPPSHAVYPVVDLRSSAHDLARFARAILRGGELDGARVLSAASVQEMLEADASDPDQALGWQLRTLAGSRVAGHEGEDLGASTMLFVDREGDRAAVVLANGDAFHSGDHARIAALADLVSDLLAAGPRP